MMRSTILARSASGEVVMLSFMVSFRECSTGRVTDAAGRSTLVDSVRVGGSRTPAVQQQAGVPSGGGRVPPPEREPGKLHAPPTRPPPPHALTPTRRTPPPPPRTSS